MKIEAGETPTETTPLVVYDYSSTPCHQHRQQTSLLAILKCAGDKAITIISARPICLMLSSLSLVLYAILVLGDNTRSITPASGAVIPSNTTRSSSSNKSDLLRKVNTSGIAHVNENQSNTYHIDSPEKIYIVQNPPPFYLPILKDEEIFDDDNHHEEKDTHESVLLRWGILGLGRIAHDFTSALRVSGCNITAVASTSPSRAQEFATLFSIPTIHTSYEDMASDPNVDIVYVATTNQNHMPPTMLLLKKGKNILVEKPTTVLYQDTLLMYDEAKRRGLFLMTNHWTRFFPLIKYLRRTFLAAGSSSRTLSATTSSGSSGDDSAKSTIPNSASNSSNNNRTDFHLGKVLAMHGDFSFITPLNSSDRFLNRSLGGGSTLDVGCYLIELALLAVYDHRQSQFSSPIFHGHRDDRGEKKDIIDHIAKWKAKLNLNPKGVVAVGHGIMNNGLEYPVDVESSFSLRWGGGSYGIQSTECISNSRVGESGTNERTAEIDDRRKRGNPRSVAIKRLDNCGVSEDVGNETHKEKVDNDLLSNFTMIASFQTSFRRPSTFQIEYVFEYGRIVIAGPGNCPNEMTIFEYEPFRSLVQETTVSFPLPPVKNIMFKRYGKSNYPRAEGFVYVIDAIEKCMAEKGVPGRTNLLDGKGCLELEENTNEEQLVTVEVAEKVLKSMNYFNTEVG